MVSVSREPDAPRTQLEVLAAHLARTPGHPRVILDIGAADGEDTVRYATAFPNARVLAFEPLSFNVEEIRRAVDAHGLGDRVRVFQVALSDADGEVAFWVSGGTPPGEVTDEIPGALGPGGWRYSSSMLEPLEHREHWPWCTFERETVSARRLDSLVAEEGIADLDFAHIDVQGAELAVLRGMGSLLGWLRAIRVEVSNTEMYRGQPLRADVEAFLSQHGFELALDKVRRKIQGDQLWVR